MVSDEVLRNVAFVKRAKNRRAVLGALHQPAIPSEIVVKLYGRSSETFFATVSRSLRELEEAKLVELVNPGEKTGRIYRLTQLGRSVLQYLAKTRVSVRNEYDTDA